MVQCVIASSLRRCAIQIICSKPITQSMAKGHFRNRTLTYFHETVLISTIPLLQSIEKKLWKGQEFPKIAKKIWILNINVSTFLTDPEWPMLFCELEPGGFPSLRCCVEPFLMCVSCEGESGAISPPSSVGSTTDLQLKRATLDLPSECDAWDNVALNGQQMLRKKEREALARECDWDGPHVHFLSRFLPTFPSPHPVHDLGVKNH